MKRGGWQVRERERLRSALASLDFLCPDCPTTAYAVWWDSTVCRNRARILHLPTCPVNWSPWLRSACTGTLAARLRLADVVVVTGHRDDVIAVSPAGPRE